jgi:hypothetical protein
MMVRLCLLLLLATVVLLLLLLELARVVLLSSGVVWREVGSTEEHIRVLSTQPRPSSVGTYDYGVNRLNEKNDSS